MRKPDRRKGKLNKSLCILAASACCIVFYPQTVWATDETLVEPDYSVEVTPEMQEAGISGYPDDTDSEGQETTDRIMVTNGIYYEQSRALYVYEADGGNVYANVLDGMMTANAVQIQADEKVKYSIYRESDVYTSPNSDGSISETGSYSVMAKKSGAETSLFSFQIIGTAINDPLNYELPDGCVATSVLYNGEDALTNNRSVNLSEEGSYQIAYECARNGMQYELVFTVDHTPPKLSFDGVKKGKARSEVTINGLEDGDSLYITLNGQEISSRTKLTQPGEYMVKVSDAAGNSKIYSFYILFYLNTGGISFGLILLASIIALSVYLYISRKRLRIR